jgi:hypothetical protein
VKSQGSVCVYTYSLYIEVRIRILSYEFKPPVKDLIAELCQFNVCVDTLFAQTQTVVYVEKDELYTGRGRKI